MNKFIVLLVLLTLNGMSHALPYVPEINIETLKALAELDKEAARTSVAANKNELASNQNSNKITPSEKQLHEASA